MLKDSGFFLLLFAIATASDNVAWFIGGQNHPNASADVTTCGRRALLPCINLSAVLEVYNINNTSCATNQGNWLSTTVIFLSGTHVIPTLCFFRWNNLTIRGEDNANVTIRGEGNASILSDGIGNNGSGNVLFNFVNGSNITVINLHFSVTVAERVALLFENSSDVSVINCTYHLPARNSKGININQPQRSVIVQGCMFRGGLLHEEKSEGLHIIYGEGISTVRIEECDFKEFFISAPIMPKQKNLYRAHRIGQALVLNFSVSSTGQNASVSRCHFMENFVYSGSTFLIVFHSTSTLNNVYISECQLIGNVNLYGGVGIYYWGETHNNNVSINDSIFSDNLAFLEGGGVFAAFLSPNVTNLLTIGHCIFKNNTANEGAAMHLFNSPMWSAHAVDIRNELVSVNIINCSFTSNTALGDNSSVVIAVGTEGIINAVRIRLFLSKTKYVHL